MNTEANRWVAQASGLLFRASRPERFVANARSKRVAEASAPASRS